MVNALVNNLPSTAEFAVARHALRTPKFTSNDAELAKTDLGKAIAFITDEMFTHNSLNLVVNMVEMNNGTRARDHSGDIPNVKNSGGASSAAEPSELRTAIMSLTTAVGRLQQQSNGGRGAQNGTVACRSFAESKCRYGDLCRFSHSSPTAPDARMRAGKMLPQYERAIEDFNKKPYAERMAALNAPHANTQPQSGTSGQPKRTCQPESKRRRTPVLRTRGRTLSLRATISPPIAAAPARYHAGPPPRLERGRGGHRRPNPLVLSASSEPTIAYTPSGVLRRAQQGSPLRWRLRHIARN